MSEPLLARKDLNPCSACGHGLMRNGLPLVWRVTVERIGIDARMVKRQAALETLVGSPAIASVMTDVSDFGVKIAGPITMIVCEECALKNEICLLALEAGDRPEGVSPPESGLTVGDAP